jgi:hypothetical protein
MNMAAATATSTTAMAIESHFADLLGFLGVS